MAEAEHDRPIGLNIDLDGSTSVAAADLALESLDARSWGPRLRMLAREADIERFYEEVQPRLRPLTLFGSGDFHHLSALWLRRLEEPFTLVMFDNHPDWDRRPPRWSCGGWLNRALELPSCRRIVVLGCANFELEYPSRLFGRTDPRLEIHPWKKAVSRRIAEKYRCLEPDGLPQAAAELGAGLGGQALYVSIDLDAFQAGQAVTNWEPGLFSLDQVASIVQKLGTDARLLGGDICGCYSVPVFERTLQRVADNWDHPKLDLPDPAVIAERNALAVRTLWNALAEVLDRPRLGD